MPRLIHDIGRRRAWAIWAVALSVYVLAVFHRSSLGVAGLLAADRFHVEATQLAFFTVLQLAVYAGMQVPVGVLLDRFGPRRLLLTGLVLMTLGQLAFAFATSFPPAVLARAVLGAGDAMVFVSVIRLVVSWFLVRQAPMVTQLTGQIGQLGAIAAAAPLSWLLGELGWTRAFATVSTLGVLLMVGVVLIVKDSPYASDDSVVKVKLAALARSVRSVWGNPGTRLGMWSHFTTPFASTSFAMLWGFPFLVQGQQVGERTAGVLLMVMTAFVVVSGLSLGWLVSRFPFYRSWLVVGVTTAMALWWAVVLLRSTPAPLWMLVVLVCVTGAGGPASMVGFDLARSFHPAEMTGRANGVVNVGGFVAALVAMGMIGVVLDLREPRGVAAYDLGDFRPAFATQYLLWALGVAQVLRYRRKGLAHLRRVHPGAIEQMRRGEPFVHPGFHDREGV